MRLAEPRFCSFAGRFCYVICVLADACSICELKHPELYDDGQEPSSDDAWSFLCKQLSFDEIQKE